MTDWSAERGIATEPNIDRFIVSVGGQRLDRIFPNAAFQNADYIFPHVRILIELKILETEFGTTEPFLDKETVLQRDVASRFGLGPILRGEPQVQEFYAWRKRDMYRAPRARITKKANRQLRESKAALADPGYRGLLWLVNDNFRHIGADLAVSLLCSTLIGQNTNVDGLIYVTNHYVDLPGSDFANLLWVPAYADAVADDVPIFVDWLGGEWFKFCEAQTGRFDNREVGPDIAIRGARPIISSPRGSTNDLMLKADD